MILIVGGAGYIGSHTNRLLNRQGFKTIVFDNLETGHKEFIGKSKFFRGDLRNIGDIEKCFEEYPNIKAVIHFAAYAYVGESVKNPMKYYKNNVIGTINLLEIMKKFNCKNIVFSSTCATYGIPKDIPISEEHPQKPINPYGKSKYMIEQILFDYEKAYGLKYVIFRYFNAAGASYDSTIGEDHTPETHIIPLLLDVALKRKSFIEIYGNDYDTKDGTCIRDYIHVEDLANAHYLGVKYLFEKNSSNIYNLSNGRGFSVKELVETVEIVTKKEIPYKICPRRVGDPAILIGSYKKAENELGWNRKYKDIKDIIYTAWQWHKKRFKK